MTKLERKNFRRHPAQEDIDLARRIIELKALKLSNHDIAKELGITLSKTFPSQNATNKVTRLFKLAKDLIGPDGELKVDYGKMQRKKGAPKPDGRLGRRFREQIKDKSYSERHNTDILARVRARNGARLKKSREKN